MGSGDSVLTSTEVAMHEIVIIKFPGKIGFKLGVHFKARSHDLILRSDSWFRKLDAVVQTVHFQDSVFVGACYLSRRVSYALFPSAFKLKDPCVGSSFSLFSYDPIFGTNKNRILEVGSCERPLWDVRFGKVHINIFHQC